MALPLKSHPLYYFRKASIIIAVIGILLSFISFSPYSRGELVASAIFLTVSTLFCAADLVSYATQKLANPDEDPKWPTRKWMLGDVVLAPLLQFIFWAALGVLSWSYGTNIPGAYAALAGFLCSVLHAWCFWKQLMARKKDAWLASLPRHPCVRCGYEEANAPSAVLGTPRQHLDHQPPNTFTYAGPSADFRQANFMTPQSPETAMEEGLLIGSDFSTGYGSIGQSETTIEQPEEVVVGKGKKKKGTNTAQAKANGKKSDT